VVFGFLKKSKAGGQSIVPHKIMLNILARNYDKNKKMHVVGDLCSVFHTEMQPKKKNLSHSPNPFILIKTRISKNGLLSSAMKNKPSIRGIETKKM